MPKINKISGIKQEQNKTWTVDYHLSTPKGLVHIKKKNISTYKEAVDYLDERINDILNNSQYTSVVFEVLLNDYRKMRNLRFNKSTCHSDESVYNIYFLPYFKGLKIKDIFNQRTIKEWYENLVSDRKHSDERKAMVLTRMKDIIEFAWTHEYIDSTTHQQCNIVLYPISYNKKAKTERVVWTELEERKFLKAIEQEDKKDYLYFSILLNTGLRLGEFLGLQGKSFDPDTNKLTINQQVVNSKGDGWELTEILKTHESYRNVILPPFLSQMLKEHIKNFNIKSNEYLIFLNDKDKPISRTHFRRKLNYYCEVAGIRKANPHALRHNQAVKLASICDTTEKLEIAARRLGHSPSMFMDTYANHTNDEKQEALLTELLERKV